MQPKSEKLIFHRQTSFGNGPQADRVSELNIEQDILYNGCYNTEYSI